MPQARMRRLVIGTAVMASALVKPRWWAGVMALGGVVAVGVIGLSSAAGRQGMAVRSGSAESTAYVLRARPLPGDRLLAGPVLLDDQYAAWAEAGRHRLLVRSLDVLGRTRTIFSTSRAPGAPKGSDWPFEVSTLAANDGRVAFVEHVMPCWSAPAGDRACGPGGSGPARPWNSSTLFAGRPGAIRAVERVARCGRPLEPWAVAVSSSGIVVDEEHDVCPGRFHNGRVVLRSFDGRPIRVLAPAPPRSTGFVSSLGAAGSLVSFVRNPTHAGRPYKLVIIQARTGTALARVHQKFIGDGAVDSSGEFAILSPGPPEPCQAGHVPDFARLVMGRVGSDGLRVLVRRADWNGSGDTPGVAIAHGQVAFFRPRGRCLRGVEVAVASPGRGTTPVPDVGPARSIDATIPAPIAFDGHLLATRRGDTVELTATDCPGPTVPSPAVQPAYTAGPTELVSGLYAQGGPVAPPCRDEPRGPYRGTIIVTDRHGRRVTSRPVRAGQLAQIRLARGKYEVSGRFATGARTVTASFTVRAGQTVRQDAFVDVP